ncbi:MAG: peptide chain release factor N(5)-glutamine methyltransferase [Gammaproteobacteria bacterium]|nr:peptide chain release factor N(5)-glutamine methyltransferase [Gammaproteobacteria bacterium]
MQTVRELLQLASARLGASDSPRLDAEVLLASALGTDRSRLYAHPEMAAPQGSSADFLRLLDNRRNGFPVAYLTGEKEFRSITFRVNRHTLIPRPETELVVEAALEQIPDQYRAEVLDLGTGSGAIAVAVASERPDCAVTAVDLSIDALAVARENAATNHVANISFEQSDWFGSLHNRRFDAIICNPPYVRYPDTGLPPEEIRYEPRLALDGGHDGTACIRIVIASGLRHINPGGFIIIEHAHNQGGFVREQFRTNHYRNITTSLDHAGHERCTRAFRA